MGFRGATFHPFESGDDMHGIVVEQAGLGRLDPLAPLALAKMNLCKVVQVLGAMVIVKSLPAFREDLLDLIPDPRGAIANKTETHQSCGNDVLCT